MIFLHSAGTTPALAVLRGYTDSSAQDQSLGSSSPTANLELALGFVYKLYRGSARYGRLGMDVSPYAEASGS